jgi:hypothetical protein
MKKDVIFHSLQKKKLEKTRKPIGWCQKFHKKDTYLDCASTILTVLELFIAGSHHYSKTIHE